MLDFHSTSARGSHKCFKKWRARSRTRAYTVLVPPALLLTRLRKVVAIQKLCLCVSCRSSLESLILRCTQNANHPGHPGSADQRGDYPTLRLGKLTSSGRSEDTAAFLTGAAKRHWMPKVSPVSLSLPSIFRCFLFL